MPGDEPSTSLSTCICGSHGASWLGYKSAAGGRSARRRGACAPAWPASSACSCPRRLEHGCDHAFAGATAFDDEITQLLKFLRVEIGIDGELEEAS